MLAQATIFFFGARVRQIAGDDDDIGIQPVQRCYAVDGSSIELANMPGAGAANVEIAELCDARYGACSETGLIGTPVLERSVGMFVSSLMAGCTVVSGALVWAL